MKKTNNISRFLIGLFLMAFLAGCVGNLKHESTGEFIDNSALTAKVKADIFSEPTLTSFQINVETFKGVVQLSGFVNSRESSGKAEDIAKSVKGVIAVENNLIVK